MSPELFGDDYSKIRFICHNAHCIPYNPNNDYVERVSIAINNRLHDTNKPTPRKLTECVIRCNQLVPEELGGGQPFNLLAMINSQIDDMTQESPSIDDRLSKISPLLITILITVLVASLVFLCIFPYVKK